MKANAQVQRLWKATDLIRQLVDGEIDFETFIRRYSNFYYDAALDGHEGSLDFIRSHDAAVRLHRRVQEEVINKAYVSPQGAEAEVPGRISHAEATRLIVEIARDIDVTAILQQLRREVRNDRRSRND